MAVPQFTVVANLAEITGATTGGVLDTPAPTDQRVVFSTNITPPLFPIAYAGVLNELDPVYAGWLVDGTMVQATMGTENKLIVGTEPVVLVGNRPGESSLQYKFTLEIPIEGTPRWEPIAQFWFTGNQDGSTLDLADVVPPPGHPSWIGPTNRVIAGYFDEDDAFHVVNLDGTPSAPIGPVPNAGSWIVDNHDGTASIGTSTGS